MTKIIAEVGSNFRTLDDCLSSITIAKAIGADAVKFQLYSHEELYGVPGDMAGVLPREWIPRLASKASAIGIEFMCTAFSVAGYEWINPYVSTHKVASAEGTHRRILEALNLMRKPVILSTGAKGENDIRAGLKLLEDCPVTLLYCAASYPAQEVDLSMIKFMREKFKTDVGYSDHTTDVLIIPKQAALYGATVIEKHFTAIPEVSTPDRPHSLDPEQFKRMIQSILGKKQEPQWIKPGEQPMVLRHNRRLIAIKTIQEGEQLVEGENFGIFRSKEDDTHAFSPLVVDRVDGRFAKRAIQAGQGIGPRDV